MPAWTDSAWRAAAEAWIGEQAGRLGIAVTGPVEQPHVLPWATVLRVPAAGGDLWFKANAPALAHEGAVTEVLARACPGAVPAPLAVDRARGFLLMRDAGRRLREVVAEERDLGRWLDVLPRYAELQLAAAAHAGELLALGLPDRRPAALPRQFAGLLDRVSGLLPPDEAARLGAVVGRVGEMCAELAASGVPATVQHDDLHDGQVFLRDGAYLFMDWGDACLSHPFLSMSVALEGVLAWGVDDVQRSEDLAPYAAAYLGPFAGLAPAATLREALATALRLGWICRALTTEATEGLGPDGAARVAVHLRMFLDGRP